MGRQRRSVSRAVGLLLVAPLLTSLLASCSPDEEDPVDDAARTVSDAAVTSAPAPPTEQDDATQGVATQGPATTQEPPTPVDLETHLTDEDLLDQTRWALSLLEPDAGVIPTQEFTDRFAESFQEQINVLELSIGLAPLRQGAPYTVTAVSGSEGTGRAATVVLHSDTRPLILSLGLDEDGRMSMLLFQEDSSGEPPELTGWADLDDALTELGGQSQVVVGQVRDGGCQVVHTTSGRPDGGEPFPTGSVFKLMVLAAVADAVTDGDLAWDQELEITDDVKSLPSGVLQERESGSLVTVEEAAGLMISISDNTATDLLVRAVGQERIEASAVRAGVDPARPFPIPTTRELFILGWGVPQEVRTRWAAATTAEERAEILQGLPRDLDVVGIASISTPVWQDQVDWPLTGAEVCSVHARLQQLAGTGPGAPVREILAENPGGQVPEGVSYQGFKGGSAPGVLALSYYLEGPDASDGRVLVVQTRSDAPIDQLRAVTIVDAALRHLAGRED